MLIAVRTPAPAGYVQKMHPVAASREYTAPLTLPTNTRPPATVGCAKAIGSLGNPKAHFSLGRPTAAAASPGFGWWCELSRSSPHPFQSPSASANAFGGAVQRPPMGSMEGAVNSLLVTYRAIARPSSSLKPAA